MRSFYTKSILFFTIFIALYIGFYRVSDYLLNKRQYKSEAIYIWGDSQLSQAIKIETLKDITGKNVHSASYHAGGVYDLMVFANKVPENSTIVLGFSYGMLLRKKFKDYNRSGLSVKSLYKLYEEDYSFLELGRILKLNIGIDRLYQNFSLFYPTCDTSIMVGSENYVQNFMYKPSFLENKKNLIQYGINELAKKNCKIILLTLPFHDALQSTLDNSEAIKDIRLFEKGLVDSFSFEQDSIKLYSPQNVMYDLSHLNELGAMLTTNELGTQIKSGKLPKRSIINYSFIIKN